ncbi:MAG: hypothetical protein A3F42_08715 [Gammaproteobacteria bacterium RIFCSPHIGHO2_12_FULL_37_34]|nr:MAG: hypothetical protein A3F42_08715 [Gammaproteobacteria bacterium RIFCSPHIGHO2_12_FULL_37_34]
MGVVINLDKNLVDEARTQSKILHRSIPKQIEHWARIEHIAEDNPDLTYSQIKDILLGLADYEKGNVKIFIGI